MQHIDSERISNFLQLTRRKKNLQLFDFAVPVADRVKLKEGEKINGYLNLARELKKLWDMKVTVIPLIIEALGTIPNILKERQEL